MDFVVMNIALKINVKYLELMKKTIVLNAKMVFILMKQNILWLFLN